MAKLTDSQLVILNASAQGKDGGVLPLPKSIRLNKAAATDVLNSLIRHKLVQESPATKDDELWREDGGRRLALRITAAGLKAIGADEDAEPTSQQPAAARAAAAKKPSKAQRAATKGKEQGRGQGKGAVRRIGTKLSLVIELLSRKDGATLPELVKATGWQAHSVRGAMSGALKKKMNLKISSTKSEKRGRVYRIER